MSNVPMLQKNDSGFSYSLEKSPKKKVACPQCVNKGKFRFYENRNGNRIESSGMYEGINK